jgi:2-(1,2-epoxy-1,2-dihydrophenyl)acetyl-CoA isomerase
MELEYVILEKADGIATIRLNRPKEFNAVNFDLFNDIIKAFEICHTDKDVKTVIVTGEGKAFCSGGDVAMFKRSPDTSETLRQLTKLLSVVITGIRYIPKPVIAMINGVAAGVGISIAAACDLRICAASAKFRQAYTSIGLVPDGAWTLLVPQLIGFGKAAELMLLDPLFDGAQALEYGLVNRVVEDAELEQVTRDLAVKITQGPPISFAIAKDNFNSAFLGLLERQLELERRGLIRAGGTADVQEGLTAFFERRKPQFTGQ